MLIIDKMNWILLTKRSFLDPPAGIFPGASMTSTIIGGLRSYVIFKYLDLT